MTKCVILPILTLISTLDGILEPLIFKIVFRGFKTHYIRCGGWCKSQTDPLKRKRNKGKREMGKRQTANSTV